MNVNTALLRQFILEKFSADDLTAFLFDYFREVYNDVSLVMSQNRRIQMLLEYCQNRGRYPDLFEALERERPGDFRRADFSDAPEVEEAIPTPKTLSIRRNPRQIFMSYAHQDKKITRQLANDLKVHGWDVWMAPDSIQPGEKWMEAINRGLASSGKVLLILTPDAAASSYVQDETNAAVEFKRHGEQIEILPLDVKPVLPTDMPFTWLSFQRISFPGDYKDALENLLTVLQPDLMNRLDRLYHQLKVAVGNNDWETVQTLGKQIKAQYSDYRETTHLINLAQQETKRKAKRHQQAEQFYQQLQTAIEGESWDHALRLVTEIEQRVKAYRDVAGLAAMIREKQRQQRKQERTKRQPEGLKRVPVWSWGLLLIPFVVWGVWAAMKNGGGEEDRVAALHATGTAQTIAFEATLTARPVSEADGNEPTQLPVKTTTATTEPTAMPTETATATPEPTATATVDPNIPPVNAELGDRWTRTGGMEMVYVPGETFLMGSDPDEDANAEDDELPQHEVTLDSFWIDRTEVTNAQFANFVEETGHETTAEIQGSGWNFVDGSWQEIEGADWQHPQGPDSDIDGLGNHPVVLVSWDDADAYCRWSGGRLPTEAEWEYAARGDDGRLYPWGNDFDGTAANFCDANCGFDWRDSDVDDGYALTAPVGSYSPAGDSWVEAADMAGNVWEWTDSWYQAYPGNDVESDYYGESYKVLRGGGWDGGAPDLRVAGRDDVTPVGRDVDVGFRCVAPPG